MTLLALLPRDGFFCKDARGWYTSTIGKAEGLDWPRPWTIRGALTTAIGRQRERAGQHLGRDDWRALKAKVLLSTTFAIRRKPGAAWSVDGRRWPVPADALALTDSDQLHYLQPAPPSRLLLTPGDDLWLAEKPPAKTRPLPRWWSEADFVAWLAGEALSAASAPTPAHQLHIKVSLDPSTLTAADSLLYSYDTYGPFDEEGQEWAVAVQVQLPEDLSTETSVTLGGKSRLCHTESLSLKLLKMPAPLRTAFAGGTAGLRLVLITPGSFGGHGIPSGFSKPDRIGTLPGITGPVRLRAAVHGRPLPRSGWDMAIRLPKPLKHLAPVGSVWFFDRPNGALFTDTDAAALWLAGLGNDLSDGCGRVVPGTWTPPGVSP